VGLEILQPMAIVVIGGLVTTVAHALLVVPALASWAPPPDAEEENLLEPAPSTRTEEGSR
jgi:Cu/Ag efflux pump CusA